jgi:hypothetical protein
MIATTTKAINEQAASMNQISAAADGMSTQADQVLRGAADQARAMRSMTTDVQSTAKQIKLMAKANVEHSSVAAALLGTVSEIRQITDRNAAGVKQTRGGTDDLRRRAQALAGARRSAVTAQDERAGLSLESIGSHRRMSTERLPLGVFTTDDLVWSCARGTRGLRRPPASRRRVP